MPGPRNRPRKIKKRPKFQELAALRAQDDLDQSASQPKATNSQSEAPRRRRPTYLNPSGDGPGLSNVWEFMNSSYAVPPSMSDSECALFASENVLHVLCRFLPEELALIIWYNKTRLSARICAVCRRFYELGEVLPPLGPTSATNLAEYDSRPELERERKISGLCSFICFGVASYNTPGAGPAWGKMQDEIDTDTMRIINTAEPIVDDEGLGALFKLTRRSDVGVGYYVELITAGVDVP